MPKNSGLKSRRNRKAGRHHPLATVALLAIGLMLTGGAYSLLTNTVIAQAVTVSPATVQEGHKLFAANCATCHGTAAEGTAKAPSLLGVSPAAVTFLVSTGGMPLGAPKPVKFTKQQIAALTAYVASLAPAGGGKGPAMPDQKYLTGNGDVAVGAQLFRLNCAACHNIVGAGGALTGGKAAPSIAGVSPLQVYEAMLTGPQNMPVFTDAHLTPQQKSDIISYLKYNKQNPSPGGFDLGNLGPVPEGLLIWIFGLGTIIGATIWLTARSEASPARVRTNRKEKNVTRR